MRALVLCLCLLFAAPAAAEGWLAIELFGGVPFNLRTPLTVRHESHSDIELTAHYDTRALEPPLYYAVRFGVGHNNRAVELQFIHDKLYLMNPPPEIEHFEITHGYNILTFNGSLRLKHFDFRLGAGFVLAHAEAVVRGEASSNSGIRGSGYELTGPAFVAGIGKRIFLPRSLVVTSDIQLIAARARVTLWEGAWDEPIGEASVPTAAFHLLVGIGYLQGKEPSRGK